MNNLAGLNIYVVPTWATGWRWERFFQPRIPPRSKRTGTRRQWKRAHPQGLRWRFGPVEPDQMLRADSALYCTARQYGALRARLSKEGLVAA